MGVARTAQNTMRRSVAVLQGSPGVPTPGIINKTARRSSSSSRSEHSRQQSDTTGDCNMHIATLKGQRIPAVWVHAIQVYGLASMIHLHAQPHADRLDTSCCAASSACSSTQLSCSVRTAALCKSQLYCSQEQSAMLHPPIHPAVAFS
jgi:hypothetical protein